MAKIIKIPSVLLYESKVVGVSQSNADGSSRQQNIIREVRENAPLYLETEPSNPFDPNAIKVLSGQKNQIGYLNKGLAAKVKPALDNQAEVIAKATWVSGEKTKGVGIRIELVS